MDADEEELQSAALGFDDPRAQGAFISFLDDNDENFGRRYFQIGSIMLMDSIPHFSEDEERTNARTKGKAKLTAVKR